jgi:outer membrane protein assembly factor BamE (lipoprotein component of BamABCDE complex)
MVKTKRVLVVFTLLAALAVTWLVVRLLLPIRFTEEMADRIRPGMTEAEVVAILGRPAGDYTTGECYHRGPWWKDYTEGDWGNQEGRDWSPEGMFTKEWLSDEGGVQVLFGGDGRAVALWWLDLGNPNEPPSLTARLQRWLQSLLT